MTLHWNDKRDSRRGRIRYPREFWDVGLGRASARNWTSTRRPRTYLWAFLLDTILAVLMVAVALGVHALIRAALAGKG